MKHATASSTAPASGIDADPRDNVIAYRNMLAGLWASRLMQIPDDAIQSYVAAVHQADLGEPRCDGVVEKLFGDLNRCGVSISREEVRRKLCEFHSRAIMQTRETD
ncbi:ATPase inhibitor subunit zeta [Sphingosinicella soli]|uniref:DUF1476 domain-containing protein n=1 Tax=Sphingosinicella soli TaxID=333708 RepID=A0A7W7AYH5_9SPHN|nr:ATPase inhibitor subunit zeta [Sphingosinicella soli]MBB4630702.1 hypothetical protein [Sphingosinicella soli]